MLEACDPDVTLLTDGLGRLRFIFVVGIEHSWIEPPTGSEFPPHNCFG